MADRFVSALPTARPFLEIRPLLRALGIASDSKKLILSMLGLLALWAGWSILVWSLGTSSEALWPIPLGLDLEASSNLSGEGFAQRFRLIAEPIRVVVAPFASLFVKGTSLSRWFQTALMAFWAVVVWGIFGGAITRIAIVQVAGDHRVGLLTSLRFVFRKISSLIGAPLTPFFGVALFSIGCAIFGLMTRIPWGIGSTLATVLGFVPLLLGLVMALILLGLALGWPLMVATIACEGEDAPDALSRSYSYVNQRLARYAVHIVAGGVIGAIGLVLVGLFGNVVLILADWGTSIGAGSAGDSLAEGLPFWRSVVGFVVHAWVYSYFWTSFSTIYLILRRDVDGTPWHDVYLTEIDSETFAGDLDLKGPTKASAIEPAEVV